MVAGVPRPTNEVGREVEAGYAPQGGYECLADGNPHCPLNDLKGFPEGSEYRNVIEALTTRGS